MIIEIIKFFVYAILIVMISKYILVKALRRLAENLNLKPQTVGNISGIFSDAAKIVGKDMAFQIVNGFNAFMINLINILVDFFRGRRAND